MAECQLVKTDKNTFVPMGDELNAVQAGEIITVKFSFVRNPAFHRKMFALFKFVFDALPEPEAVTFRGQKVVPLRDFDTARKELIILAGFHEMVIKLDGTVKLKQKALVTEIWITKSLKNYIQRSLMLLYEYCPTKSQASNLITVSNS